MDHTRVATKADAPTDLLEQLVKTEHTPEVRQALAPLREFNARGYGNPQVTPEMQTEGARAAGDACFSIFQSRWPEDIAAQIAVAAYQAIYAVAPVDLVTEAERIAQTTITILSEAAERSRAEIVHLHLAIVAREAQIAELNTVLAARPVPVPDTPKPNPFRDHSRDMRRIGG